MDNGHRPLLAAICCAITIVSLPAGAGSAPLIQPRDMPVSPVEPPEVLAPAGTAATGQSALPASPATGRRLDAVSVPFVENDGQWPGTVRYVAYTFAGPLLVAVDGTLAYEIGGGRSTSPPATLSETFVGGAARPNAGLPHATRISSYLGNDPSRYRQNVHTYEHVGLGEVYRGIDVRLRATGRNVEKIFTVAPGADPRRIALRIEGASGLRVDAAGALVAATPGGEVAFTPPVAFQTIDGRQRDVPVRYALDTSAGIYGFALGRYDTGLPLTIDPLLQATYLGGDGSDLIRSVAVHASSGQVIVAGTTSAANLAPSGYAGANDTFVARLSADLTTLLHVTYLGGSGNDNVFGMAIHPASGEVIVAGQTFSGNLPQTAGAVQTSLSGPNDGFVMRLSADVATLLGTTYIGGSSSDQITGVAISPVSGEILVTGSTLSTDFPSTAGGAIASHASDAGSTDAFVARLSANLGSIAQATYYGGTGTDPVSAIAVHPITGEVYIAGTSTSGSLMGSAGAAQPALFGTSDGYIVRFSPDLKSVLRMTYLGGSLGDQVNAIAFLPGSGDVVVAGFTLSSDFPGTVDGVQPTSGNGQDGFVARLSQDLRALLQATYLGGTLVDSMTGIAVHPQTGEVLVSGSSTSPSFPGAAGGVQAGPSGSANSAVVVRLNPALIPPFQSTYYGGALATTGRALAIHPVNGEVYLAGDTRSTNLAGTTGGAQAAHATESAPPIEDGYIARMTADLTALDKMPTAFTFASQVGVPMQSDRVSGPVAIQGLSGTAVAYVDGQPGSRYCVSSASGCSCDISVDFLSAPGTVSNGNFVCVRHTSSQLAGQTTRTVLHVGGAAAPFIVSTAVGTVGCTLDFDGNGTIDALTDGLIVLRAMFGLTGSAVTNGAVGTGATRTTWAQLQAHLNGNCSASFAP